MECGVNTFHSIAGVIQAVCVDGGGSDDLSTKLMGIRRTNQNLKKGEGKK